MSQPVYEYVSRYVEGLSPSSGNNYTGFCPIHGEKAGSSKKSFSFNAATGQWFCFAGCGGGGLRGFLKELGKSRDSIDLTMSRLEKFLQKVERKPSPLNKRGLFVAKYPLPERILGLFQWCPDDLVKAGFDEDMLWAHDVGFDHTYGRITYPIRDIEGTLAGIVGRNNDPSGPKYKVYKQEIRDAKYDGVDKQYDFDNHDYVWRWDKVYAKLMAYEEERPTVYVTEGFKACLWMVQHGYWNTVALMGMSLSQVQKIFFQRIGGRVVLCLDNNSAGRKGTYKIGYALTGCDVRVMAYPDDEREVQQPDDLSPPELHDAVERAESLATWRRKYGFQPFHGASVLRPRRAFQQEEDGVEGGFPRPPRHPQGGRLAGPLHAGRVRR